MVIIPNNLTFVATPRTASRAITESLLRKYPDALSDYPKNHHMWPESVPLDYKIYAVIRDPVDQIISWWSHVDLRAGYNTRPLEFAKTYENIMFLPKADLLYPYRLNIYASITDVFMKYDDDLKEVSKVLKLNDIKLVGKSNLNVSNDEREELREYMKDAFYADMKLWKGQNQNLIKGGTLQSVVILDGDSNV